MTREESNEQRAPGSQPTSEATEGDSNRPALADQRDVASVYGPAEDSRLLAESVAAELSPSAFVLDVGTGSGYVADWLREMSGASVVGSDITPAACEAARDAGIPVVRGNLVSPFAADSFDAVVCNPPYLPTPPEREWDDQMEAALSGGPDGRAVIRPFVETVGRVLSPDGRVYLLISTLTGLEDVRNLATDAAFRTTIMAEESHAFETLLVLELVPESG